MAPDGAINRVGRGISLPINFECVPRGANEIQGIAEGPGGPASIPGARIKKERAFPFHGNPAPRGQGRPEATRQGLCFHEKVEEGFKRRNRTSAALLHCIGETRAKADRGGRWFLGQRQTPQDTPQDVRLSPGCGFEHAAPGPPHKVKFNFPLWGGPPLPFVNLKFPIINFNPCLPPSNPAFPPKFRRFHRTVQSKKNRFHSPPFSM